MSFTTLEFPLTTAPALRARKGGGGGKEWEIRKREGHLQTRIRFSLQPTFSTLNNNCIFLSKQPWRTFCRVQSICYDTVTLRFAQIISYNFSMLDPWPFLQNVIACSIFTVLSLYLCLLKLTFNANNVTFLSKLILKLWVISAGAKEHTKK